MPTGDPGARPRRPARRYDYLTDGAEIYRRSFATIREEADLHGLPEGMDVVATRIIHAAGDVGIVGEIAAHPRVVPAARAALGSGAPILTDSHMLASGVTRRRLPGDNEVICTLRDARVAALAAEWSTTRAAAAVSLWEPHLEGAVVAIGNAPTALFHLLELLAEGAPRPAAIVGMPVGFIGSAESKDALAEHRLPGGDQVPWVIVRGRRGGSAMAAGALNALATADELA
ncbi:precorrin-8X methylmutase [Cumulibacter manganitolerans]|uniref:precorrin-8X methylmutase n=1 Tax=Cumulibacter manganitolerans TaxID=1884992 RepID=UPI001294E022|nr:precorrin-8X methylmutase [Cumulibacter manganitolerans]